MSRSGAGRWLLAGVLALTAAAAGFALVRLVMRGEGPSLGAGLDEAAAPAAPTAPAAAPGSPAAPATTGTPARRKATIFQRAATEEFALVPFETEIDDLPAPGARARQIAQLVLGGVPDAKDALTPTRKPPKLRAVHVTAAGVAWIDLDAASVAGVGADEELSLVGALSRSLTVSMPEIKRVGLLLDGHPRESLAGHVDLKRTYTGAEFPSSADATPDQTSAQ